MQNRMSRYSSTLSVSADTYLLLDGLASDVPFTAYTHDEHPVIEPLFRTTRHAEAIEASPWLVKPSPESRLFTNSKSWRHSGLVLHSDATMNTLADHLRSLISVRMPSKQLAYCRFYSPDWASRLFDSMTDGEFEAWSGPVSEWHLYSEGNWSGYTSTATSAPRKAADEGWYMLRQDQLTKWEADEYEHFVGRAAQHLGLQQRDPYYANQKEYIRHLVQQAQSYGFTLEHQCMHYLELAWRFGNELSAPNWEKALADRQISANERLRQAEQHLFGLNRDA